MVKLVIKNRYMYTCMKFPQTVKIINGIYLCGLASGGPSKGVDRTVNSHSSVG